MYFIATLCAKIQYQCRTIICQMLIQKFLFDVFEHFYYRDTCTMHIQVLAGL